MAPQLLAAHVPDVRLSAVHRWAVDIVLVVIVCFLPNLLIALHFMNSLMLFHSSGVERALGLARGLPVTSALVWLLFNIVVLGMLLTLRQWLLVPLRSIAHYLQQLHTAYYQDVPREPASALSVVKIASELGHFASFALEQYRKHQEVSTALDQSRQIIAQFALQQEAILGSTNREIATQYRSVLAYANYLEGQIANNKLDAGVRYDFDDVCESSFNLKLIAGALSMLSGEAPASLHNVPLAPLMQQTMVALAPSLDRRAMKLTTAEVDESVAAFGDPTTLAHILWMMMLGMIRYAADESTLRIRCLHSRDASQAMMSIVVTELAPGKMSEHERGDHLARQLQHLTPHMFAETIRIHGNTQLADLLLKRLGGHISVLPLTIYSCEICVTLPSARF